MAGGVFDYVKDVVKGASGFDAYGYIRAAIDAREPKKIEELLAYL